MIRVDVDELTPTFTVSRADYEADRQRGFTVLEYSPKMTVVHHNPRYPDHKIERESPAVLLFRCMTCQFDAVDSYYPADKETKQPRTGLDLMRKHLDAGQHPWPYNAFASPYGNVRDVRIEGVEDYTKELNHV